MKNIIKLAKGLAISSIALMSMSVSAVDENFNTTLNILPPLTVSNTQPLIFGDAVVGVAETRTIAATDAEAAQFNIVGIPGDNVIISVVQPSIDMLTGSGTTAQEQIPVSSFTIFPTGGVMTLSAGVNTASVGASAFIQVDDVEGNYNGIATLRVIYQ